MPSLMRGKEMGYATVFDGKFTIDRPVDEETYGLLARLANERDRDGLPEGFPHTWCDWLIQGDHQTIEWDEEEHFYDFEEWVGYIVDKILSPRGYVVNGEVMWRGEDFLDMGRLTVRDNVVGTSCLYEKPVDEYDTSELSDELERRGYLCMKFSQDLLPQISDNDLCNFTALIETIVRGRPTIRRARSRR